MQKKQLTIHRYSFTPTMTLPEGAVFIDIQAGQSGPSVWFLVDPTAPTEERNFCMVATGQPLPNEILDCQHLATIKVGVMVEKDGQQHAVSSALHFFECTGINVAMPTIDPSKPKPADPADWWKQA